MDPTCKYVIGGLVVAVVGMAGYIVKQHLSERTILQAWIKSLQDVNALLNLVARAKPDGTPPGGA